MAVAPKTASDTVTTAIISLFFVFIAAAPLSGLEFSLAVPLHVDADAHTPIDYTSMNSCGPLDDGVGRYVEIGEMCAQHAGFADLKIGALALCEAPRQR